MLEYHHWFARYQSWLTGLTTSCYHLGDVGSPPAAKFGYREISEILWKATLNPKSLTHSKWQLVKEAWPVCSPWWKWPVKVATVSHPYPPSIWHLKEGSLLSVQIHLKSCSGMYGHVCYNSVTKSRGKVLTLVITIELNLPNHIPNN